MDFDIHIDRRGTRCAKWDALESRCGVSADDAIAMWVADMDFRAPDPVQDALAELLAHGVYGYHGDDRAYREAVRWWMEARHGRLWEQGLVGIEQYNSLRKVEPMKRALKELGVGTWFTGLRRVQATSRANAPVLQQREDRWKVNPIVDWTDRDVWQYMKQHGLPYHPLWEQGYVSIGDFHTTRRWEPGMREEDTRFNGLKRECGIHIDV